jgi:hypothetical protein
MTTDSAKRYVAGATVGFTLALGAHALAELGDEPLTGFSEGSVISASEVNSNFARLEEAVRLLEASTPREPVRWIGFLTASQRTGSTAAACRADAASDAPTLLPLTGDCDTEVYEATDSTISALPSERIGVRVEAAPVGTYLVTLSTPSFRQSGGGADPDLWPCHFQLWSGGEGVSGIAVKNTNTLQGTLMGYVQHEGDAALDVELRAWRSEIAGAGGCSVRLEDVPAPGLRFDVSYLGE